MKFTIKMSGFILLLITLTSCKKQFLEVDNYTQLYRESYVKDLSSMEHFLKGIYILYGSNIQFSLGTAYPEVISDNLKLASDAGPFLVPHYSWAQQEDEKDNESLVGLSSDAVAMNPLWKSGYQVVRACNFVIERVDQYRNENPAKADNIKGQAYAFRALVHFVLANTFAQTYVFSADGSHLGIPYITTSDISKPFSRQTVAENYANMIEDLQNALEVLPETAIDTRFINLNATRALLARIYLFKGDFENAKIVATEVANDFPLMTIAEGYPINIFKLKSPDETESLFQLTPQNDGSYNQTFFLGYFLVQGQDFFHATNDIATILTEDANDVRSNWVHSVSNNWIVTKFPTGAAPEVKPDPYPASDYYPAIIRSSEMFLTVAEAAAKTGDENTARNYLDAIRKRANPSIASITAIGSALIDSIYKERRKELAFEELRMYDLQRWKLGVHRGDAIPGFPTELPFPSDKAIAPIPPNDVRIGLIPQNPGY